MYDEKFSKLYDKLHFDSFCIETFDVMMHYIKGYKIESHLDLACGTGIFNSLMNNRGILSEGLDLSVDMIKIARKKYPNSNFYVDDMTKFKLNKYFDLITCNFDAINHLKNIGDVKKCFSRAYEHLNDNGLFIFDFNNINTINTMEYREREVDGYLIVEDNKPISLNEGIINISIYKSDMFMGRIEVLETFYKVEDIYQILSDTGFRFIRILNNDFSEYDLKVSRTRIICIK